MGWVPVREAVSEMMAVGAMVVGGLGAEGGREVAARVVDIVGVGWGALNGGYGCYHEGGAKVLMVVLW